MPVKLKGTYYDTKEAAKAKKRGTTAIKVWCEKGLLNAQYLRGWYVLESDLKSFIPPAIGRPWPKKKK